MLWQATKAVVARKPGSGTAFKERLANYKVPKRVLFVEELPRNAMGKVQKDLLRECYRGLFEAG